MKILMFGVAIAALAATPSFASSGPYSAGSPHGMSVIGDPASAWMDQGEGYAPGPGAFAYENDATQARPDVHRCGERSWDRDSTRSQWRGTDNGY
jgi:hypothetical protein